MGDGIHPSISKLYEYWLSFVILGYLVESINIIVVMIFWSFNITTLSFFPHCIVQHMNMTFVRHVKMISIVFADIRCSDNE